MDTKNANPLTICSSATQFHQTPSAGSPKADGHGQALPKDFQECNLSIARNDRYSQGFGK